MKRSAFTLIEVLVCVAICAILLALIVGAGGGCSVSDGTRVGTISKFSKKGVLNKSYEGEMVLGGLRNNANGGVSANVWYFTVVDKEIIPIVQAAMDKNAVVSLKYNQTFLHNPLTRDTSYLVTGVTVVTNR